MLPRRRLRAIVVGSLGNLVEWYDFYVYAAFSLYFAGAFFPPADPLAQQLNAAVLFGAAFVVRPFGGWLFGWLADRRGRRAALTLSVASMCAGSLVIALSPTFATIGVGAPVLLAIARVIEGVSLGGEYGASATYLSEIAHPDHRGLASSFQYVTLIGGQLIAILVLFTLQETLGVAALRSWGWRIPFAIGAALAIVVAVMRRTLDETEAFRAAVPRDAPRHRPWGVLWTHPRESAIVVGLTAGGTAAFYTFTTYMQTFAKLTVGLSDRATTAVMAASLVFASVLQPLYGALSDRIGRKPLLVGFGVTGTLCTVPLLEAMRRARSPWLVLVLLCAAWLFVAAYTSINAVVKAELFPAEVRVTGVSVPYAITVSLFGGTAPAMALWCKQAGHERWFFGYLATLIGLSSAMYIAMRDTRRMSAMREDRVP